MPSANNCTESLLFYISTRSVLEMVTPEAAHMGGAEKFFSAVGRFLIMFFASALIGAVFGIVSAMVNFSF